MSFLPDDLLLIISRNICLIVPILKFIRVVKLSVVAPLNWDKLCIVWKNRSRLIDLYCSRKPIVCPKNRIHSQIKTLQSSIEKTSITRISRMKCNSFQFVSPLRKIICIRTSHSSTQRMTRNNPLFHSVLPRTVIKNVFCTSIICHGKVQRKVHNSHMVTQFCKGPGNWRILLWRNSCSRIIDHSDTLRCVQTDRLKALKKSYSPEANAS
mmetsp:Transcript_16754/g.19305  ORF Transcript_16754/g.19305 Transcript_16754/m.19305 type:complete len:210 (+) Transcript_16754:913-1542(+)